MNYAIILSGGIGTRMRRPDCPKQYIDVGGRPILMYTVETFQNNPDVDRIVIVAADEWRPSIRKWMEKEKVTKFESFADPGKTRQESFLSGLEACMLTSKSEKDGVIIHEAVRPLLSSELISECLAQLERHDGCMPVLPLNDTIYQSDDGRHLSGLADRSVLFAGGQSPESFRLWKFTEVNRKTDLQTLRSIRGASELAFMNGLDMYLIRGEDNNFKITTGADLDRFRGILGMDMLHAAVRVIFED